MGLAGELALPRITSVTHLEVDPADDIESSLLDSVHDWRVLLARFSSETRQLT